MSGSHLYYYGTKVEVQLGDGVEVSRGLLFRRRYNGSVSYLPGVSEQHTELENGNGSSWAISLEDGTILAWAYLPDELQPSKRIRFIQRDDPKSKPIKPDEEIL